MERTAATGSSRPAVLSRFMVLSVLAALALAAFLTRHWVLLGIPVGFLFGFFLQKGDLCGASALSEIILFGSRRKLWGIWVCLVTAMGGIALADLLGWVVLSPNPCYWLNMTVGGAVFGMGMVLAGGCVTGSLFKAGSGNLNSMAACAGIPLGVATVRYGLLSPFNDAMRSCVFNTGDGGVATLPSLTGVSYQVLTLIIVLLTTGAALMLGRRSQSGLPGSREASHAGGGSLLTRSWKPWQAGLAVGILAVPVYLASAASGKNYPLGTTGGLLNTALLITEDEVEHVWSSEVRADVAGNGAIDHGAIYNKEDPGRRRVEWWLVLLCLSLVAGSWFSGRLAGASRLLPKPPEQVVVAFFGGLLVGAGAGLADGCFYGNVVSGWALMSVGSLVFGLTMILANWVTAYFYLLGGSFFGSKNGKGS